MTQKSSYIDHWTWVTPVAAWAALITATMTGWGGWFLVLVAAFLGGAVFAAVHHAEVIAHRIGEPYGTLVLAVAVTVIEVALIISIMLAVGDAKAALARDTVFAAIMIVCNGIVGICLLLGGLRHREQVFHLEGASAALAVLAALSLLALVLPNYATTVPGPMWSPSQLAFSGIASLVLYGAFVFIQTIRHRDYFLATGAGDDAHAPPPSVAQTWTSVALLFVCLVAVVGLAKALAPAIEAAVLDFGAPEAVVGLIIAALVLLPEGLAAARAARADKLQTSLNLALGSALASIGLTIPVIAAMFIVTGRPLILGLSAMDTVLLLLTLLVIAITLGTG
ncbi:MAG: ionic transporter y4hA, partial [Casimicrobiaceae bacterium]